MTASLFLCLSLSLLACPVGAEEPNTLSPQQKAAGWRLLFDGKSLESWTAMGEAQWRIADGAIIGDAGGDGWLCSKEIFQDFLLSCEFRNVPRGNSGIFLRASKAGTPYPAPEHGYELQINNEEPKYATGSIEDYIQRLKPVSPAPNEWHRYDIEVVGNHFVVTLDGQKVLDGEAAKFASGHIGLQYHRGSRIEFRNIKIRVGTRSPQ